ncbi:MAG TPA: tripartite tricarboxylate transporter TctB family protein [Candidatus Methylomirabilis sp.]|nr:tripartite tricarboxylate transporter TctB family protein [Candidatus Methylomirabilis sp.]
MRTQRGADFASGLFLSLLGLLVILAARRIAGSPDVRLEPRTLPMILGWTILVAGAILTVHAWRFQGEDRSIKWPNRAGTRRIAVTLVSLTAYLFLMEPLGLPLGTVLFVAFLVWYLGRYRVIWAAALGLVSGATVYYVFIRLLELSFPVGPLGR